VKQKYVKHQTRIYRFPIVEYFWVEIGRWERRLCFLDRSEFLWKFSGGQFSGRVVRTLQGWSDKDVIVHGKEDNSRNLSGYHQPPQSVKRQLQALFCARPDCRHGRNHRHRFCLYSSSAFSCTDTCTAFKSLQRAETFPSRISR